MKPAPYVSTSPLFRSLNPVEVCEFQNAAREAAIRAVAALSKDIHHPVYRGEMQRCILRLGQADTTALRHALEVCHDEADHALNTNADEADKLTVARADLRAIMQTAKAALGD